MVVSELLYRTWWKVGTVPTYTVYRPIWPIFEVYTDTVGQSAVIHLASYHKSCYPSVLVLAAQCRLSSYTPDYSNMNCSEQSARRCNRLIPVYFQRIYQGGNSSRVHPNMMNAIWLTYGANFACTNRQGIPGTFAPHDRFTTQEFNKFSRSSTRDGVSWLHSSVNTEGQTAVTGSIARVNHQDTFTTN